MNKNQYDEDEKPVVKKKKKGCCGCLVSVFVVFLVIIAAGVGVGWYFGDKYTKQNLDMSLLDCFKVLSNVNRTPANKIVTNGYSDDDLDAFYSEIKKQLLLKDDVELDTDVIIDALTGQTGGGNAESVSAFNKALTSICNQKGIALSATAGTNNVTAKLMALLQSLYTKENVDTSRLEAYTEQNHSEYMLKIYDKGIAAFIDELIPVLADSLLGNVKTQLTEYGITDVAGLLKFNQLTFYKQNELVEGAETEVTKARMTMSVKTRSTAATAGTTAIEKLNLPSAAEWALNNLVVKPLTGLLLPRNIYFTAEIGLTHDIGINAYFNNMNSSEMANVYKLADQLTNKNAGGTEKMLDDLVNEKIMPYVKKTGEYVKFAEAEQGRISVDLFDTVVGAMGINSGKEEEDKINGRDILTTMKALLTTSADNAVTDSSFNNWYYTGEVGTNGDKIMVYKPASTEGLTLVDFKKAFMEEIGSGYALDFKAGTPEEVTFEDLLAFLGVGTPAEGKNLTFNDLISKDKLTEALDKEMEDLKAVITDQMMGAVIDSQLGTFITGSLADMNIKTEQVVISVVKLNENGSEHTVLGISLSIQPASLLPDNALKTVLEALMPEKIVLTVKIDITDTAQLNGEDFIPSEILYNDLTYSDTEQILNTISKLGAASIDKTELLSQMEKPIRDIIVGMRKFLPNLTFAPSKMIMPDLFTTISEMMLKDGEGVPAVNGAQLKSVLKGLVLSNDSQYLAGISTRGYEKKTTLDGFKEQLASAYYLDVSKLTKTQPEELFKEIFTLVNNGGFNSNNFNLTGDNGLLYDKRSAAQLRPVLTDEELTGIILGDMNASNGTFDNMTDILEITVGSKGEGADQKTAINMLIQLDISGLVTGENTALMPVTKMYLRAEVTVDEDSVKYFKYKDAANGYPDTVDPVEIADPGIAAPYYPTVLALNDMKSGSQEFDNLIKMTEVLGGGSSLNLAMRHKDIGNLLYDQLLTLKTSLGEGFEFAAGSFNEEQGTRTAGGIKLESFYNFINASLNITDTDAEVTKGALQGLYARNASENTFNYNDADFTLNPIADSVLPEDILSGSLNDNKFGAFVKTKLSGVGVLDELSIFAAGVKSAAAQKRIDWLKSFDSNISIDENKDYMLLSFTVEMSAFGNVGSNVSGMIPAQLHVTMLFDLTNGFDGVTFAAGGGTEAYFRINSMTLAQQKTLFKIAGINDVSATVMDKINECIAQMSTIYSNASYSAATEGSAYGNVSATFIP